MSANDGRKIYLGRGGRIHEFPAEKMDELRLSGEIANYTYMWDEGAHEWRNIDPMPPEPGSSPESRRRGGNGLESSDAICHDYNDLVSGQLENVSDFGCELVSRDHSDAPKLALNAPLMLNVMDGKGERAVNVKASLSEVLRRDGAWIYRIRWAARPSF